VMKVGKKRKTHKTVSGKLRKKGAGRVVKVKRRQTGKSNLKHDKRHHALAPGKRVSRSGKVYYEYRANRSDLRKSEVGKKKSKKKKKRRK